MTCHKDNIVEFVNLGVWADIGWGPVAHTLHMHILLNRSELGDSLLVNLSLVVPDDGDEDDLIAGYLDTYPDWRSEPELLDIFSIERLELGEISHEECRLDDERHDIQLLQMLEDREHLVLLADFSDLFGSQRWIDNRN